MNGKMLFQLGTLRTEIAGGPYKAKPAGYLGVKMAEEIDLPCEIDIPTRDFQVPSEALFKRGLVQGIMAIAAGNKLYAGCWGGIGRTGLYLAGMAKVMAEYKKKMHRPSFDPVLYVRGQFLSHAVETKQQEQYIADLDVSAIVEWWHFTQRVMQFDPSYEEMEREHLGHPVLKTGVYADSTQDAVAERFAENVKNDPVLTAQPSLDEVLDRSVPKGVITHRLEGTLDDSNVDDDLQTFAKRPLRDAVLIEQVGTLEYRVEELLKVEFQTDNRVRTLEDQAERLEGCVLALDSRLDKTESARAADLRECIRRNGGHGRKWWQIWK